MRGLDDLQAAACAVLDTRLNPKGARPIAVAYSGGGDSLALLLIADAWAREHGRGLVALHVDHGLRKESQGWALACAAVTERLGRPFEVLTWAGEKPGTGLPAAARAARHALLANAARRHGASVILMGHTADDLAESAAMRRAGSTTPDARPWGPSPAWPEGRGVFILRPLLSARRSHLRDWLTARGETWIDDPANTDPRFARSRARANGARPTPPGTDAAPLMLAEQMIEDVGVLTAPREIFREPDAERLLAMACVCAGGGDRLPSSERVGRLLGVIRIEGAVVATLAGARIEADDAQVRIFREAGEARRGGWRAGGSSPVWDGRWEIRGDAPPAQPERMPARIRRTLPPTEAVSLVGARLRAAAGLVDREPA